MAFNSLNNSSKSMSGEIGQIQRVHTSGNLASSVIIEDDNEDDDFTDDNVSQSPSKNT